MKRLVVTAIASAALSLALGAAPAQASVQTITIVNPGILSASAIQRAERALMAQVNDQLRRYWPGPSIVFGPGGWQVRLVAGDTLGTTCTIPTNGCHSFVDGAPVAYVAIDNHDAWQYAMSHELLEMLVDPTPPQAPEICDPVQAQTWNFYTLDGFIVAAFATPAWYDPQPNMARWVHDPPAPSDTWSHEPPTTRSVDTRGYRGKRRHR